MSVIPPSMSQGEFLRLTGSPPAPGPSTMDIHVIHDSEENNINGSEQGHQISWSDLPEDWPLRSGSACLSEMPGYDQGSTVDGNRVDDPGLEPQVSLLEHNVESAKAHLPSTLPSMSTKPRCYRPGRQRVMTIPLLAQKAENISRLDKPTLGPRSPRLYDEFSGNPQPLLGEIRSGFDIDQQDCKDGAAHWKNKVGSILTAKRSTSQMKEEVPTSPYRLVTVSGEMSGDTLHCQSPPSGPRIVHVLHDPPQHKEKAESVHALPLGEKPEDADTPGKARPLSYDRGVTLLKESNQTGVCSFKVNSNRSKTDSGITVNNGDATELLVEVPQRPSTPNNTDQTTLVNIEAISTPDMTSRPVIQPRSSSKQPMKSTCDTDHQQGLKGKENQLYRTASSETVRIYDLTNQPSIRITPETPIKEQACHKLQQSQGSQQNRQRSSCKGNNTTEANLSPSKADNAYRLATDSLKEPGLNNQRKHQSTPTPTNASSTAQAMERNTADFSRKESLNQMRLATKRVLKQRQQGLMSSVIPSGTVAMEKISRIPKVSDLAINTRLEAPSSLPTSPVKKQVKSSLPVPKRAQNETPDSHSDHGLKKIEEVPSYSDRHVAQDVADFAATETKEALTGSSASSSCDTQSYSHTSGDATASSDELVDSPDKARSTLLADGYMLKQLSGNSPVHGPQLRVAPDATNLIMGDHSDQPRPRTRKSRSFFQDFRMSEPMFSIKNFGGTSATGNARMPKVSGITTSQSATCLSSRLEGNAIKEEEDADALYDGLRSAPLPSASKSSSSLKAHGRSKSLKFPQGGSSLPPIQQAKHAQHPETTGHSGAAAIDDEKTPHYVAHVNQEHTSLHINGSLQPAITTKPPTSSHSNAGDSSKNLNGTKPMREVPSSSSLQSRFYSQSKASVPLPKNMVQTKYSLESLSRQPRAPELPAADTQSEATSQQLNKETEVGTAAAHESIRSPVIPANPDPEPVRQQRTREYEHNLTRQRSTGSQRPVIRTSKLPRNNAKSSRNMFAGFKGLFSRKDAKAMSPSNNRDSLQTLSKPRAKLVKKGNRDSQNGQYFDEKHHQQLQRPQLQPQPQQTQTKGRNATTNAKRGPLPKRVLSPRVVPWPAPLASRNGSTTSLVSQRPSPQMSRRSVRRSHHQNDVTRNYKPVQPSHLGTPTIRAIKRASMQDIKGSVCGEMEQLLDSSKASNMTAFTMEVLEAARRERNEAKKVRIIKLAKILVAAVNHAHEAEKAMLVATQAAKQAELSCSLAQEKAMEISEIARQTLKSVQGGSSGDASGAEKS